MRCPECGAEGQDTARFCLKCGQALTQSPAKKRSRVRQGLWWMLPMGIGMFLAAIVVTALLLWLKPPSSEKHDVQGASSESNARGDDNGEAPVPVITEQSTTEPTAGSTATVSPTATVRPTVTSSPTATPLPTEEESDKQGYVIHVPVVMRHHPAPRR